MALTDAFIRAVKPETTPKKYSDGGGLFLYVSPPGGKLWRMAYRFNKKQKLLSFGPWPSVSLKEARTRRDEAKTKLALGIDPGEEKRLIKLEFVEAEKQRTTFETVAREWFLKKTTNLAETYRPQILARLENQLFPHIGNKSFSELEPTDILSAIRHTEERGSASMAHRLLQLTGQICRYARLCGYAKYDASAGLNEALSPIPTVQHRATISSPAGIGALLHAIDAYPGDPSTLFALKILPYVFLRSRELRGAVWEEINFDTAEWIIPADRMKMRKPHTVPLARQVVELLRELQKYSGFGELLFPSPFSRTRCITDVTLLNAIRRMGYGREEMSIHGFRGMASTLLNEQGYRPDVIEAQLAHSERNSIRAAYNHAEYMPERREMMQNFADYLDKLRDAVKK